MFHPGTPGAQFQPDGASGRIGGPSPDHESYSSFASFRPGWQRLAAARDHDPASWARRPRRDDVRLDGRHGERPLARPQRGSAIPHPRHGTCGGTARTLAGSPRRSAARAHEGAGAEAPIVVAPHQEACGGERPPQPSPIDAFQLPRGGAPFTPNRASDVSAAMVAPSDHDRSRRRPPRREPRNRFGVTVSTTVSFSQSVSGNDFEHASHRVSGTRPPARSRQAFISASPTCCHRSTPGCRRRRRG